MGIRKPSVFTVLSNLILPHLIPFLNYPDPNLVLPVFSNHTMYTMTMITRPRFLAMMAILLAALCSLACACTGEPQCCVRRRMGYGTSHRRLAMFSRSAHSIRRRLDMCPANDPCGDTVNCDRCKTTSEMN